MEEFERAQTPRPAVALTRAHAHNFDSATTEDDSCPPPQILETSATEDEAVPRTRNFDSATTDDDSCPLTQILDITTTEDDTDTRERNFDSATTEDDSCPHTQI